MQLSKQRLILERLTIHNMERLRIDNFDTEITKPGITYVVFGIINCKPCSTIKNSIDAVRYEFSDVRFCHFSARGLNTKELEERYGVTKVPQSIVFQDGVEVTRHLGAMAAPELRNYLKRSLKI